VSPCPRRVRSGLRWLEVAGVLSLVSAQVAWSISTALELGPELVRVQGVLIGTNLVELALCSAAPIAVAIGGRSLMAVPEARAPMRTAFALALAALAVTAAARFGLPLVIGSISFDWFRLGLVAALVIRLLMLAFVAVGVGRLARAIGRPLAGHVPAILALLALALPAPLYNALAAGSGGGMGDPDVSLLRAVAMSFIFLSAVWRLQRAVAERPGALT
jgi:hypothetical protein